MTQLKILVPRLNDTYLDFIEMAKIWREVDAYGDGCEVDFDFSQCPFIQPNGVVFLGGVAHMIISRGGRANFLVNTLLPAVRVSLFQNGFANAMGATTPPWQGNSIPYRHHFNENKNFIAEDLRENWLGRGWIKVSKRLADELVGQMWEIFANAFEHGDAHAGVFSCGQYYKKKKVLTLVVADFGVGIPSNVRLHLNQPQLSGAEALKWAFRLGNTTSRRLAGPRGIGLDLLKELVRKTGGSLSIYSHDGRVHIDEHGERYGNFAPFFEGTLVQIQLICDDTHYTLSDEVDALHDEPFF